MGGKGIGAETMVFYWISLEEALEINVIEKSVSNHEISKVMAPKANKRETDAHRKLKKTLRDIFFKKSYKVSYEKPVQSGICDVYGIKKNEFVIGECGEVGSIGAHQHLDLSRKCLEELLDGASEFYHIDYDGILSIYIRGENFNKFAEFIEKKRDEAFRKMRELYKNDKRS